MCFLPFVPVNVILMLRERQILKMQALYINLEIIDLLNWNITFSF